MNKYVARYKKIVDGLIKKSFPELKNEKIIIVPLRKTSKFIASISYLDFFSLLFIKEECQKYTEGELKGILAHELSHIEIIRSKGFFEKICFGFRWAFLEKARIEFEREADLLSIKKGYGQNRIQANNKVLKNKDKNYIKEREQKGYLSNSKIKQEMKKLK